MIICSQVGFGGRESPEGDLHQAFASVDLSVGEASTLIAGARWLHDVGNVEHGPEERAAAELLASLDGRYKVTVRDKRLVLASLFCERILSTCLRTGQVVPFVENPEAAFQSIICKRLIGSDKTFAEQAEEAQTFLEILHDLSYAPTFFAEGRDPSDDRTMARIMAYVDTHWNNVRGYHSVGPFDDFGTLVAESMGYTTALLHLTAWGERASVGGAAFAATDDLQEVFTILQASIKVGGEGARFPGALSSCVTIDDPRAVVARFLAQTVMMDLRTAEGSSTDRLRSHMPPPFPKIEADTLMKMIFRTPKYVATADQYREWEAERSRLREPGEIPRPTPGTTWLDHHAFRSRVRHPDVRYETIESAMVLIAAAAIASRPAGRARRTPADVRGRFESDLAAFFDPDYVDSTFLLQLPPGFFRLKGDVTGAEIDAPVILAHFADKPFTFVDCPSGSFELGDDVEVKAVFARSAQITRDGRTKALGPESRFILDAVVGRSGYGAEHLLSWYFAEREAMEVFDPFGRICEGALPETPFDLLKAVGRTQGDVMHQVEEALGRALRLARYGTGGPCLRRLLRFEWDDIRLRGSSSDPKRSLFDVVVL